MHIPPKQPCPHWPQFEGSVIRFAPPHGPPVELDDAVVLLDADVLLEVEVLDALLVLVLVLVDDVLVLVVVLVLVDDVLVDVDPADEWCDEDELVPLVDVPVDPPRPSTVVPAAHAAAKTTGGNTRRKGVQLFMNPKRIRSRAGRPRRLDGRSPTAHLQQRNPVE
jgi:hypothetical protein